MLTISVPVLPTGGLRKNFVHQATYAYMPEKVLPGPLLSIQDPIEDSVVELQRGSLTQDDKAWGKLRDHGVKHFAVHGDIQCPQDTYQQGTNANGDPYAVEVGTNLQVPYTSVLPWGSSYERTYLWTVDPYVLSGRTYTCPDGIRMTQRFVWSYNKALWVTVTERGAKLRDGSVFTASSVTTVISKWLRKSDVGKLLNVPSNVTLTRLPTSSDYTAALLAIPLPGNDGYAVALTQFVEGEGTDLAMFVQSLDMGVDAEIRRIGLLRRSEYVPDTVFGDLALECATQVKFVKENVLGLFVDIADWRQTAGFFRLLRNDNLWRNTRTAMSLLGNKYRKRLKYIKATLGAPASAYLGAKYGVLPTVSDLRRLMSGVENAYLNATAQQRLHSRQVASIVYPDSVSGTYTATLTVEVAKWPDDFLGHVSNFITDAKRWGLYPEMQNVWDVLYASFVADWVVNISDYLTQLQDYKNLEHWFPVKYCICSEKWERAVTITELVPSYYRATGVVEFTYYVRWMSREVPLPNPSMRTMVSQLGKHSVEATALGVTWLNPRALSKLLKKSL